MNLKKAIQISSDFWRVTAAAGLANVVVENQADGRLADDRGRVFINMSSYSYLGLDCHPDIIDAAANAIRTVGALNSSISRTRIHFDILKHAEDALSDLFRAETLTTASCAAAAAAVLPLTAAGVYTGNRPPLMVFDKNAHFCLNVMKPICADEADVVTIPHNDLDTLEDLCKKHGRIAYVADGVYSTGGKAPVKELLYLQDKYGLFLVFDEAHGLSAYGKHGRGYVLEEMGDLNEQTLIITSLNKGFGASGGAILLGPRGYRDTTTRFGGPLTWSQRINTAGLGAILASVVIHRSTELDALQAKLQDNIAFFDSLVPTENAGDGLPIRLVPVGSEENAIRHAQMLTERGYYTSPLFFPIIAKGKAGLRVMLRANLSKADIVTFCNMLGDITVAAA